jgi:hypothetical protein
MFLEQYVVLGNYIRDPDRPEVFDAVLLDLLNQSTLSGEQWNEMDVARSAHGHEMESALALREEITRLEQEHAVAARRLDRASGLMARVGMGGDQAALRAAITEIEMRLRRSRSQLEKICPVMEASRAKAEYLTGQYQHELADYLNEPENAHGCLIRTASILRRCRRCQTNGLRASSRRSAAACLASYQLRNICHDYCPPIHLQQLKRALVFREEAKRVEDILKQFPARRFSTERLDEIAKKIRRMPRAEVRAVALRFAEDFMRLRRDTRNYERLTGAMERVSWCGTSARGAVPPQPACTNLFCPGARRRGSW